MKVALIGKGGSGKTTASALLARSLGRRGICTVALDCDTNPNLGISLGLGEERTEALLTVREAVDAGTAEHAHDPADLLARYGVDAPDGVRLAVVNAIENPKPGCPCCGVSPEQLLGQFSVGDGVIVADLEAGLGTAMRLGDGAVDVVIVVVEPTATSLDVGRRAADLVQERSLGRLVLVANRVRDAADLARVRAAFPGSEPVVVPEDQAIAAAERLGVAPMDAAPDAPAVRALVGLAETLSEMSAARTG